MTSKSWKRNATGGNLDLPSLNAIVNGEEVDAYWPQYNLVVELDSWEWHRTRAAFERDRQKWAKLGAHGIRVLPFTWRQLKHQPGLLAAAARSAAAVR